MYDNLIPIIFFVLALFVVAIFAIIAAVFVHTTSSNSDKLDSLGDRLDELTSDMDVVLPYIRETRYNVGEIAAKTRDNTEHHHN